MVFSVYCTSCDYSKFNVTALILLGPEKKQCYGQIQVYVIRWHPSQCSVDPIEEIILDDDDLKHVIEKVS